MSQAIWSTINPATTSGNQLATLLNDFKEAMVSGLSGTSRPTELDAGGFWIDTTNDPSTWTFKIYDGTTDISVFTLNLASGSPSFGSSDSLFTIAKVSADTVAPILKFTKERIASNGQVLIGDVIGEVQFIGGADDNSNPISARLRVVATDDFTNSESASYLILETTAANSTGVTEFLRVVNGRMGIGVTSPDRTFQVRGTGIQSEKVSDDTVPARIYLRKRRIAGSAQVVDGDGVGSLVWLSTDDTGTEQEVASIESEATESHESGATGTDIIFKTSPIAGTPTELFRLSESQLVLAKYLAMTMQVDSTTTGANQAITPTTTFIKLTNASLTSINNIVGGTDKCKLLLLKNAVGGILSIVNDTGGTASDRIVTGTAANIDMEDLSTLLLAYDSDANRWTVVGGSGGGSGSANTVTDDLTLTASDTLAITVAGIQTWRVQGNAAAISLSNTPFGTTPPADGGIIHLIGNSDTNSVTLNYNDAADGCIGNFSSIELFKGSMASFMYSLSLDRYVLISKTV
jgi:hypothetical protein